MTDVSAMTARHPAGLRELERDFLNMDRDGDRRLNLDEFRQLLLGLEADLSEEEMRIGFHEVDTNLDGLIDVREFIEWWNSD